MTIDNKYALIEAMSKIKNSIDLRVQARNPETNYLLAIQEKLKRIEKCTAEGDSSLQSKEDCDMSSIISSLYPQKIDKLGEILCDINAYFQQVGVKRLTDDHEALEFFLRKGP